MRRTAFHRLERSNSAELIYFAQEISGPYNDLVKI